MKQGGLLFGIRGKIFGALAAMVAAAILVTMLVVSILLRSGSRDDFIERANSEIAQVDNLVAAIIAESVHDVDFLLAYPPVRDAMGKLNTYKDRAQPTKLGSLPRSATEAAVYTQMMLVQNSHPDYMEVYLGMADGGFVTSGDYETAAGYNPSRRPWYLDAVNNLGKPTVSKAYLSANGQYVIGIARTFGAGNDVAGAAGIDISLAKLTEIINRLKLGEKGFVALCESDGTILAYPPTPRFNSKNLADLEVED
jgi:methyl-accepting chemotaxis protein